MIIGALSTSQCQTVSTLCYLIDYIYCYVMRFVIYHIVNVLTPKEIRDIFRVLFTCLAFYKYEGIITILT